MSTQMPSPQGGFRLVPVVLASTVLVIAVGANLFSRMQPEAAADSEPRASRPSVPPARDAQAEATANRLLALERRVMELSAKPAVPVAPPIAPRAEPPPAPEMDTQPSDPKEQEHLAHLAFEQQVEVAMRAPVDSRWASRTGRTLQDEIQALRGGDERYRVVRVDCRTHTCLAELDFSTFSDARAQLGRLVVNTNLEGCGSTGHIDPTEDPASRSKMRLFFDCDRSREAR